MSSRLFLIIGILFTGYTIGVWRAGSEVFPMPVWADAVCSAVLLLLALGAWLVERKGPS